MSDRILQKYINRTGDEPMPNPSPSDGEEAESFGCWGFLRGVRDRATTIELRKKSGHILAINYAFISKFEFEPATGIILHCGGGQLVKIKGRNLNGESRPQVRLFQNITRFRVAWVQEADRAESMQATKNMVVVEVIEW